MGWVAGVRFVAAMIVVASCPSAPFAASGWAPPVEEDARSGHYIAKALDAAVARGELSNLHAVVVARGDTLVLERYYPGRDETRRGRSRGRSLGEVRFTADTLHDLRSVTKSIVGLLYGIALAEGRVPKLETPVVSLFSAHAGLAGDSQRRRITIEHLLTMTTGLAWREDLPYTDPRNSETAMDRAPDRYHYVLSRPIVAEPGSEWRYSGGAKAVLGHLISRGAGKPLLAYAREKLFDPLAIAKAEWVKDGRGEEIAASGLRLTPRGLARIGQVILNGGRWNDTQVIPRAWLKASFKGRVSIEPGAGYGYHWYLQRYETWPKGLVAAVGNGGQRLVVIPDESLVVVVTAGNYNRPHQSAVPRAILRDFVLPNFAN